MEEGACSMTVKQAEAYKSVFVLAISTRASLGPLFEERPHFGQTLLAHMDAKRKEARSLLPKENPEQIHAAALDSDKAERRQLALHCS